MSVRRSSWCCCSWVQSRHDQIDDVLICRLEQPCHRGVHVGAVRRDGVNARPTEHATRRPRITRPYDS